jgi:hypothetical protein
VTRYRWDGGFASLEHRDGEPIKVIRPLRPDEADEEVGPMYLVEFDDGSQTHVYADEILEEAP